jgi:hypothetical protein
MFHEDPGYAGAEDSSASLDTRLARMRTAMGLDDRPAVRALASTVPISAERPANQLEAGENVSRLGRLVGNLARDTGSPADPATRAAMSLVTAAEFVARSAPRPTPAAQAEHALRTEPGATPLTQAASTSFGTTSNGNGATNDYGVPYGNGNGNSHGRNANRSPSSSPSPGR